MSDLSELFHYLIICPFICITLAEILSFLTQTIFTKLRKSWEHFQENAASENPGDAVQFASGSANQVSICDMLTTVFDLMNTAWPVITGILHSFVNQLIQLLWRENATSDGYSPLTSFTLSNLGRIENPETERRPQVSIPDVYLRKLRSGRVYDITPVLDKASCEAHHTSGENSQNGRSPPASDNSSIRRRRRPENWFGDSYRIRQEERLPDHVQRYARPSSLLTSSSSPVSLANMLGSLKVIEKMPSRSTEQT